LLKTASVAESEQNPAYSHQKAEAIPKGIASVPFTFESICSGNI
jgi:hypothetical protein